MLRQRVITALVLLAIFLPAMFARNWHPFAVLVLVLIAAGAWEWGRLNGLTDAGSRLCGALMGGVCAGMWWVGAFQPNPDAAYSWWLPGLLWPAMGAFLLWRGVAAWGSYHRNLRLAAGWLVLVVTWAAVVWAKVVGTNFLLSVLLLVWAADIAAYFAGRRFGGRVANGKLAPSISPGKSWEGVWGGMLGVVILSMAWVWADRLFAADVPSLYSRLQSHGWGVLILAVLSLSALSVVGDLLESLVKRSAGVKDSSGLLPGHGGVLDRVDALLPVLPLALAMGLS
ncbi:MAG: hypothetical protein RLZZ126_1406 [Pseudomonadota bacterium]|jgi:phosphatidate cytidylyltransferase